MNIKSLEERVAFLEAEVKRLSKPETLKFVYPGGTYGPMEVIGDDMMGWCPTGERDLPLRQVVVMLVRKLGLRLHVKNAEPEQITLK